jgi:histidine triad (HIT) family protein
MESDNMNCIFCKIINHEIPSYTIYEDEFVNVFLDINPDSNGHMLIIPKKHALDITEIERETWNHILDITRNMKSLLEEKLKIDGLTLIQNNGMVQEVKHFHLHLKPYYSEGQKLLPVEDIYNKLKEL